MNMGIASLLLVFAGSVSIPALAQDAAASHVARLAGESGADSRLAPEGTMLAGPCRSERLRGGPLAVRNGR